MSASLKIGRIFGIPIYLHLTFLLILPLFVWVFSEGSTEMLGISLGFAGLDSSVIVRYTFGTIAAVIFFMTILAHELAHSYLALRYGVRIKSITLMIFGGVASMEEIPRKPGEELKMAFAGPLTSLVIGVTSYLGMVLFETVERPSVLIEGVSILLGLMALYNILLAGFNLIPAFPMDGGRVLRSFFASRMPHIEATRRAAKIGRYLAIAMGIFGLVTFNIWMIMIAFFVYVGASEEERSTVMQDSLEGMRVRQLMTDAVQVVHPDTSVQQLMDLMFMTHHMGFPVVDNGLVGIVTLSDTQRVPKEHLPFAKVADIMTRDVISISPEAPAIQALKIMTERGIGRLPVLDQGRLVGIVTNTDFVRAVQVVTARARAGSIGYPYLPPPQQPPQTPPPSPPTASS
jgi:Zn-dependent protease/CBS domain-containing protein